MINTSLWCLQYVLPLPPISQVLKKSPLQSSFLPSHPRVGKRWPHWGKVDVPLQGCGYGAGIGPQRISNPDHCTRTVIWFYSAQGMGIVSPNPRVLRIFAKLKFLDCSWRFQMFHYSSDYEVVHQIKVWGQVFFKAKVRKKTYCNLLLKKRIHQNKIFCAFYSERLFNHHKGFNKIRPIRFLETHRNDLSPTLHPSESKSHFENRISWGLGV